MGRSDDGEDAVPEALFCAHCGTDINLKKEEYIKVSCTVETCRQNYHVECVTDVLLTHAAKLESWRSREKYEVSAKKRPAMLLQQHWKCPCTFVAPGQKAEQPCIGFTLSGDLIKPAKNIAPPPATAAPRAAAQKQQQLPSLRATKKPVRKQLSGSTHFTAHVATPDTSPGGGRGLLSDPLGVGGGGGAKTFAQEQEEARKAAEKKKRRKGSATAAAAATAADAATLSTADGGSASSTPPDPYSLTPSSTPSAETLAMPVSLAVDPTQRAACISSLTEMGFSIGDAEAAADAAGGDLETALQLLTSGAVGGHSHSDWHAPEEVSQPVSWDWADSGTSLKAQPSDWGQQYAAAPAAVAEAGAGADAAWQYVPPVEDRGVADDQEVDELMAMLGIAC